MSFRVISKEAMLYFVASLKDEYCVVGPKLLNGQHVFGEVESQAELHLDYSQTVLPPKKYLLPQREELVRFNLEQDSFQVEPVFGGQPTVVLGVHTCDLHAIQLLDVAFNAGCADKHYQKQRAGTLLISVECLKPCNEYSFCKSMGTLSAPAEMSDLHLTDIGSAYVIDVESERGAALLDGHADTRTPTEDDHRLLNTVQAEKWPRFTYRLDFDVSELLPLMRMSYRSPVWEELGQRCLSCGSCTNVCPTCHCFDVQDEVDLTLLAGRRVRMWDSCQLDEFALVAGGHNFRPSRATRLRHRFLHKGLYQTDIYGLVGCVGCGRCAQACLAQISPVETFNMLYRERAVRESPSEGN